MRTLSHFEQLVVASPMTPFLVFVLGACVGSFLGVCIERIPRGKSIIFPKSRCCCGTPIPWYWNLPIVSWCCLRGKARCCGASILPRYLLLEGMMALLFLALWPMGSPMEWLKNAVFVSLLVVMSTIDLDTMEIPDGLSLGGLILGLIGACLVPNALLLPHAGVWTSFVAAFRGALMGSALLLWIAILGEKLCGREALGFGDIKLMGCIGAFLGTQGAVFAIFGGSFLGMLLLLPYLLYSHYRHGKSWTLVTQIPFGPFLSLGAISYLLGAHRLMDFYLRTFIHMRPFI
ncbi:MAG: prepilin peptidase [Puniceicoccales bacterium]|jgi:leader peptidase (prepilin peptidase)/N-methyltransferase|nr:prepilin peptidase [Puniceicoccales bacterium]